MTKHRTRAPGRSRTVAHEEMEPTRRLVASESVRATVVAALLGCAAVLLLDTVGMLIAGAVLGDATGSSDRLGRGILAVAATGIVILSLLMGLLSTIARLDLAALYTRLEPKDRRLAGTLRVRGQVSRTPFDPVIASVVGFGGLAILAAVPCIVLAAEHLGRLDDEVHRAAFAPWLVWSSILVAAVLLSAIAVWRLAATNRRWASGPGSRLPGVVVGHAGPAVRTTSRAARRASRRAQGPADRIGRVGRILVVLGGGIVFLGVFLHQPGLYATPIRYDPSVESVLSAGTVLGGVLLALGLVTAIATSTVSAVATTRAVRRATAEPTRVTVEDRRRVRAATTELSATVTAAQAAWAAGAVLFGGWVFALRLETPADVDGAALPEPSVGVGMLLLLVVWALCGAALVIARAALQAKGPSLRNRFGFDVPSEPDDREYPDLPLFGQ